MLLKCILLLALAATFALANKVILQSHHSFKKHRPVKSYPNGSGTAITTRYWDCCKVSCAWKANAGDVSGTVKSCAAGGTQVVNAEAQSGCIGGNSYVCNSQQPFVGTDGQAYGYAAANVNGLPTQKLCCSCYKLTFTGTQIKGRSMTVQVINTGSDLGRNHFDLQIPASGMGIFKNGCPNQWTQVLRAHWGNDYGGINTRSDCNNVPKELQRGCFFRFDWFRNADNPSASFKRVPCPAALTRRSGCKRKDD